MGRKLPDASERKLAGVNSRLANVIRTLSVVSPDPFIVTEGVRSRARQRVLYNQRKTKTLNSKHIIGRAVDIAPIVSGAVSWERKHFQPIIDCARRVAAEQGVALVFGYDWGWDAPHIEMKEP